MLDSGFYVVDSGFSARENWDSGFQGIAEFRISKPSISGFHKQKLPRLGFGKQQFPGFWNPDYIIMWQQEEQGTGMLGLPSLHKACEVLQAVPG